MSEGRQDRWGGLSVNRRRRVAALLDQAGPLGLRVERLDGRRWWMPASMRRAV